MGQKDDITIKLGADTSDATQKVDKFGKTVEQVGDKAEKSGKKTAAGGADLEAVGQKSERAASSLLQLSGAVAQIGRGGADLQSLSILAREATGTLGDLGDTLVKMGGNRAAFGGILQGISGMIGPIGVAVAGATALYTLWKSFNDETDKSAGKIKDAQAEMARLAKSANDMTEAMRRANAPRGLPEESGTFKRFVADSGAGDPGTSRIVEQLSEAMQRSSMVPLSGPEARSRTAELLKDAADGFADAQAKVRGLVEQMEREAAARQASDAPAWLNEKLMETANAFRHAEAVRQAAEDDRLAKDTDNQKADDLLKQIEIDAGKNKVERERQVADALQPAIEIFNRIAEAEGVDVALTKLETALEETGLRADAVSEVLDKARADWDKQFTALSQLLKQQREAERVKADAAREAAQAEKKSTIERQQKEADAKAKEVAAQQEVAANLQQVVALLQQLHGDEGEARTRIIDGLVKAGKPLAEAKAFADKAIPAAQQAIGQQGGKQQTTTGLGFAAQGKSLQDLVKEERSKVREGREGGTDADAIARGQQRFRDQIDAAKREKLEQQKAAVEQAAQEKGRPLGRREVKDVVKGVDRGAAGRDESGLGAKPDFKSTAAEFQQILKQLAKEKVAEKGGPLTKEDQEGVRTAAGGELRRRQGDRRAAEQKRGQDMADEFEATHGRAPSARDRRAKQQQAAAAGAGQQGGPAGQQGEQGGFDPQQLVQALGAFGQGFPQSMQEVIATLTQMAATIQNLNTVNNGVRQAAQSARMMLPGPGARR